MLGKNIGLRLQAEDEKMLKEQAEREGRTLSNLIRFIIHKHCEEERKNGQVIAKR